MKWLPKKDPWVPGDHDDDVIYAVSAFSKGKANEVQQKLAWAWLMYISGVGDMTFRPGPNGDRDTAFAAGKQFVGTQFLKMTHPMIQPKEVKADAPKGRNKRRGK